MAPAPPAIRPPITAGLLVLGAVLLAAGCQPPRPPDGADGPAALPASPVPPPPPPVVAPDFLFSAPLVQGGLVFGRAPPGATALLLDGKPVPLAADGRFILGFDRDQAPEAMLEAHFADGPAARRLLSVAPRAWPIEHVDVARRPALPDEAFQRLRAGELARIAAARALDPPADGWRQTFIWPARGRVSGLFGSQRVYRGEPGSFHNGVDVAAGAGALVVASADGIVVLAGPPAFSLEGNLVILAHGFGLTSAFLHLAETRVREGQKVRQGEPLGTVGRTGRATGPHLHWGMRWREARIDPQALAGPMVR